MFAFLPSVGSPPPSQSTTFPRPLPHPRRPSPPPRLPSILPRRHCPQPPPPSLRTPRPSPATTRPLPLLPRPTTYPPPPTRLRGHPQPHPRPHLRECPRDTRLTRPRRTPPLARPPWTRHLRQGSRPCWGWSRWATPAPTCWPPYVEVCVQGFLHMWPMSLLSRRSFIGEWYFQ